VSTGAFSWLTVTNAEGEVAAWLTAMLTGAPEPQPPFPGAPNGRVADRQLWWRRLSTGSVEARLPRRPWLATGVATAGIVAAAGAGSLGTPRTTVLEPSTTTSTAAAPRPTTTTAAPAPT